MMQHFIRLHGTPRPLDGVAFDLDSTLTRPYLNFAVLRARLAPLQDELGDRPDSDVAGDPRVDILAWAGALPPPQHERAFTLIHAFERDGVENAAWNDGARETLHAMQRRGLPVAIITRNSRASLAAVCARLGISVDALIAREDAPPKPDPACIRLAATRLGVRPGRLLMVGDFRHDTEAGRAAGAMTVLLTNGRTPVWPVEADLVIARLPELLAHLGPAN